MNTPTPPPQPPHWLVTETDNSGDYPGIIKGKTKMDFGPHNHPNTNNERQIKFSPPPSSKSLPPPTVDVLHLVYVERPNTPGPVTKPGGPYFDDAVSVMKGTHDYYTAVGYVDDVPTLVILVFYPPSDGQPKRTFYLLLVKLPDVSDATVRQGGVIHGEEN